MTELLTSLKTPGFIARVATHTPAHTIQAKAAIKQAFEHQMANRCFSFVEVLSTCPTNWGMSPREADRWLGQEMIPYYPLGIQKEPSKEKGGEK
jgi:2-oxoglutarate ferredoxin oxidoreductase subunit beta